MNKRFTDSEGRLWKVTNRKSSFGNLQRDVQVQRFLSEGSGWMTEKDNHNAKLPADVQAWKDEWVHAANSGTGRLEK